MLLDVSPEQIDQWAIALRQNPDTTISIPAPEGPWSHITKETTWRIGVVATAYWQIRDDEQSRRTAVIVPQLHAGVQKLTNNAITTYENPDTGKNFRQYSQERLESDFLSWQQEPMGLGILIGSSNVIGEASSPQFSIYTTSDFQPSPFMWGEKATEPTNFTSYFSVRVPYSWWSQNRKEFEVWWAEAMTKLQAEQGYLGFAYIQPNNVDFQGVFDGAEAKLITEFYGLDVDRPFFMRSTELDGRHLESGMRTPTYGVLLRGKWLEKIGGKKAVETALMQDRRFRLKPILDGYWVEAGEKPELYPVEEGVPVVLQKLYQLVKPAVLDELWTVSFVPVDIDPAMMTPKQAGNWLKRFEVDSNWPSQAIRDKERSAQVAQKEANQQQLNTKNIVVWGGNTATETGYWVCPNMLENDPRRRQFFNQGDILPKGEGTKGSYVWHYQGKK